MLDSRLFSTYSFWVFSLLLLLVQLGSAWAESKDSVSPFSFLPCEPISETVFHENLGDPPSWFCSIWSPDFTHNGNKCCAKPPVRGRKRGLNRCAPHRVKAGYCAEMTAAQRDYIAHFQAAVAALQDPLSMLEEKNSSKSKTSTSMQSNDFLDQIIQDKGKQEQAYCSVNNGFLAHGRPILPSPQNRVVIKSPERCLNFGTDVMVGMLEWLGRELYKGYPADAKAKPQLVIGDISGPRGGCLFGRSGRRGHASHTSGQDADIGFLAAQGQVGTQFIRQMQPAVNWWFLKKIFNNPVACIKVIFLDRHHIRTLEKHAQKDPEWSLFKRFLRHMPGHKNHYHIRVGKGPGAPGCSPDAKPELEYEEDTTDEDEISFMEELRDRAKNGVPRLKKNSSSLTDGESEDLSDEQANETDEEED